MFKMQSIHGDSGVEHAINYIGDSDSPAHDDRTQDGKIKKVPQGTSHAKRVGNAYYLPNQNGFYHRNLASWGINMLGNNTKDARKDAREILKQKNHKRQGFQLIISPKNNVDPNNPDEVYRFKKFVTGVCKKLYGRNLASYCAIQADNTHGHTHAHIITINTNLRNHKSIASDTYSLKNINRVINRQIDLDNKRYPNRPLFTKPNFAKNKIEASGSSLKNSKTTQYISKVVNRVLTPGVTIINKHGNKVNISTHATFRQALAKYKILPTFTSHRSYYHDRNNNRIPVTRDGKIERTKRGAVKYKYHLVHGLTYSLASNHHHNRAIKSSELSKIHPNCSYSYVSSVLKGNYLRFKRDNQVKSKTVSKKPKHSKEYNRLHIYRPTDVRDVMPNLRNPIKHSLYDDLHEIHPVMTVSHHQGKQLERIQYRHIQQPNPTERGMLRYYWINLRNQIKFRYAKLKKKAKLYKAKVVNFYHSEANKAGDWLKKHHLGKIGSWVQRKMGKKHIQKPMNISNQLEASGLNPKSAPVQSINSIELLNRRILGKNEVKVSDIMPDMDNINDVMNSLSSNQARRGLFDYYHEVIPVAFANRQLGAKAQSLNQRWSHWNRHDRRIVNEFGRYTAIKAGRATQHANDNNKFFKKHYNHHQQLTIELDKYRHLASDKMARNLVRYHVISDNNYQMGNALDASLESISFNKGSRDQPLAERMSRKALTQDNSIELNGQPARTEPDNTRFKNTQARNMSMLNDSLERSNSLHYGKSHLG